MTQSLPHPENERQLLSTISGLASWLIKAPCGGYCMYLKFCHFYTLKCSWTPTYSFVKDISVYCPEGCRGNRSCLSAQNGGQILFYQCLCWSAADMTQHLTPRIVNPLLGLICHSRIHNIQSFCLAQYIINGLLAPFLPCSCTVTLSGCWLLKDHFNLLFTICCKVSANCT